MSIKLKIEISIRILVGTLELEVIYSFFRHDLSCSSKLISNKIATMLQLSGIKNKFRLDTN